MFSVLMPNIYELVLIFIADVALGIYLCHGSIQGMRGGHGRFVLCCMLIFFPILYFSINMGTEIVTADEEQYEQCITDIRNLSKHGAAIKVLYEYKFAQMTLGTIFFLVSEIKDTLGEYQLWIIYKSLHWMLMFCISLLTAYVWRRWILVTREGISVQVAECLVLFTLLGLPLSCLMLKVTNYDAGSTYPAILGLSLVWAAYNRTDTRLAFLGTIVTALGAMDKWTAMTYWIIIVVLYAALSGEKVHSFRKKAWEVISSVGYAYISAIGISVLYFVYAYMLQGDFVKKIDIGVVLFSFVHVTKSLYTGSFAVNSTNQDITYLIVTFILMTGLALLVSYLSNILTSSREHIYSCFLRFGGFVLIVGIACGIWGAYFDPLLIAPFLEIAPGAYPSTDSFDGWFYHYGASTWIWHFVSRGCYEWATIMANYPTVVMLLIGYAAFIMLSRRHEQRMRGLTMALMSALGLVIVYAIAGLPADARYYSYPILVIVMASIYVWYVYFPAYSLRWLLMAAYGVYLLEMCLFIPNVKSFSPIWLWHNEEHNRTVRTGVWYAGEVMFWGEETAIAGNIIKEMSGSQLPEEITIYSSYIKCWPANPGYRIVCLGRKRQDELRFDRNSYYLFSKFALFRKEVPRFIYEVEPMAVISYKGEIGAYIYRGDMLKSYEADIRAAYNN